MPKKLTQIDFINKVKIIHGDKYDYSVTNYDGSHTKIKIICLEHGEFEQYANDHKRGRGCPKCGIDLIRNKKTYSNSEFIELSNKIHNNEYDYSLTKYINHNSKVDVICKKHGIFSQFAYNHLLGVKCRLCGYEKQKHTIVINNNIKTDAWKYSEWEKRGVVSKNFNGYKCYIIKCWNDNECFYKIGKTFRKIEDRFYNFKYNWLLINIFEGNSKQVSEIETNLKKLNKNNKYIPKIKFGGYYECFNTINLFD